MEKGLEKNTRLVSENNKRLERALEAMEQSNKEHTQLLKVVAHDLRNPIGAIGGISNLMLTEERPKEDKEMLELIENSTKNLLGLINGLLDINLDKSTIKIKREIVDIKQLLGECVELLQYKANEKQQNIILHAQDNVKLNVSREKIWRVVNNLIINSMKFSAEKTDVVVQMKTVDDKVLILVKDKGIGIPDSMRDKIFTLFPQARRVGTAGEPTFGMGLFICKQIIEAHGGKISFKSVLQEGTTFYIELPKS